MLTLPLALALAAAPIADDADFQKALALYEDLEFEQAILQFQALAIRTDLEKADKAKVLVWLGVTYGQTGNLDAAREHFELAAVEDLDVDLPVRVSPELDKAFQEAKAAAKAKAAAEPPDDPPVDDPPPVDPPPPQAPPPGSDSSLLWWTAGGVGVAGAVVGAIGTFSLGAWSFVSISEAASPEVPQKSAQELVDQANLALTGAIISGSVGVVLLGVGIAGFGLALSE